MPSGPTRRRSPRRSALVVGFLLLLVAGAATALVLTMPRLEAAEPKRLTGDATPTLRLQVAHPLGVRAGNVDARIDGERIEPSRITLRDGGERIEIAAPRLDDGRHEVRVVVENAGLLRTTLRERWSFVVDTTPPAARVVSPTPGTGSAYVAKGVAAVTKLPMQLTVAAEPGATVEVTSDAAGAQPTNAGADEAARRTLDVSLPEGQQQLTITARDEAGNETTRELAVLVDTTGPVVQLRTPRMVRDATLALPLSARDAHGVQLQVKLDGRELEDGVEAIATTPPAATGGSANHGDPGSQSVPVADGNAPTTPDDADGDDAGRDEPVAPIAGRFRIAVADGTFEGRHVLEVIATDSLGTRTKVTRRFLVDSTEQLGAASGLRVGARGQDVLQLHAALLDQQVVTKAQLAADARSRSFGAQTRAAVQKFQQRRGIEADGVAGSETVAALTLKIVIDRGAHTLTLYRMGSVVKTYQVAVGAPEFPTPAGEFEIQSMQKDPTWTPPDSEWAKDAEVTPPGPDNPLGTRWMAIDGTVGIHGTNNPASLGYSVSHGCIRMAIPDVEELYEMVTIGTPVTVV